MTSGTLAPPAPLADLDDDDFAPLDVKVVVAEHPYGLTVLLARLRAHLRRQTITSPSQQPLRLGDLVIDTTSRRCTLHDTDILLRPKEFDLLALLARHPGTAVSRETPDGTGVGRELVRLPPKPWTSPWPVCGDASPKPPQTRPALVGCRTSSPSEDMATAWSSG
ncbi:response regulator transcription factor [Streptomyces avermitilis]|uniref:response regulator transcription factor n=1 Tax=Streptomyces avermitilis TaxID=33903 RepID=UPI0033B72C80